MAKKRYNIVLDEDVVDVVRAYTETLGISFSGFINTVLSEYAQTIKEQPTPMDKKLSQMTVQEFGELMNYWFKKVGEIEDNLEPQE
jgi:antitoxin component of RelBE/YafQ-DinJ toxin-antitoxin module